MRHRSGVYGFALTHLFAASRLFGRLCHRRPLFRCRFALVQSFAVWFPPTMTVYLTLRIDKTRERERREYIYHKLTSGSVQAALANAPSGLCTWRLSSESEPGGFAKLIWRLYHGVAWSNQSSWFTLTGGLETFSETHLNTPDAE
jgi:hypothetical protein